MSTTKFVLKIWTPELVNSIRKRLESELLQAILKTERIDCNKDDVVILLVTTTGEDKSSLIEFQDLKNDWISCGYNLKQLSARLGRVAIRLLPGFIQCHAYCGKNDLATWTSKDTAGVEVVEKILAAAKEILPSMQRKAADKCYCKENAADHKGACNYHLSVGAYSYLIDEAEELLSTDDADEFFSRADVYLDRVKSSIYYTDVREQLQVLKIPA